MEAPLLGAAAAWALLAGVGTCWLLPSFPPWPIFALLFGCGFGGWLYSAGHARVAGIFALGFGLAGLHAASQLAQQLPREWERQDVTVSGRVLELPRHDVRRTSFLLRVDADARQLAHLRGKRLRLAWYDGYGADPGLDRQRPRYRITAGSHWRLNVRLRVPRGLRNPGGFDSEKHALAQRIAATGYLGDADSARQLSPPHGIDAWRERMSARIALAVARPSSRFVRALALGDTRALDDHDWERLRATGLTHLIAISGFHVGLVSGFFALLAGGLWRLWPALGRQVPRPQAAAISALLGALAYAAVAGFALPTVRTVLMIAVVVAARLWRRPQRMVDALALATITILAIDPLSLLTAGFCLSFAGVAWLLWCLPQGAPRSFRAIAGAFLSAQGVATIGLLPLTVILFGQASLAGPLANLVAIPWWSLVVVPLALLGTALESLHAGFGAWSWRLAAAVFDPSWWWFGQLAGSDLALWWLPEPRWFAVPLALLGAFWLLLPRGVPGKSLALLLWLPLLWPQRDLPRHGEAELVVIDVGQGLSVLVRTARHALLYDMGPAMPDGFDAGERAVVPALHALGVRRLDATVVSHGDNDHAGGFAAVERSMLVQSMLVQSMLIQSMRMRRMPITPVLTPEGADVSPRAAFCRAGMAWRWDGVEFRFLHPPRHFPYLGNEASCVLRVQTAHGAALLTGDIGEVIERELLRLSPADVRAEIVLVAHHGSGGSSDPDFVAATRARFALVAAGYGNRFQHPRRDVVERWQHSGATVFDTIQSGALRARLTARGVTVQARRTAHPRPWDPTRRPGRQPSQAATLSYPPD